MTKKDAAAVVEELLDVFTKALRKKDSKLRIAFGSLQRRNPPSRKRNLSRKGTFRTAKHPV
jgi:nucleoid DNA-binding protein